MTGLRGGASGQSHSMIRSKNCAHGPHPLTEGVGRQRAAGAVLQFSFHRIARVPWRTVPDTWTRPPVSCHALFPLTFRRQVRQRTKGHPSNPSRLRRGYNEAPRGALRICRIAGVACSYTHAPTYMSLTVAAIANSAPPLVLAACRAMLLCLAKGILLTFLASFWVLDWNGDGARVRQAGRAARASH